MSDEQLPMTVEQPHGGLVLARLLEMAIRDDKVSLEKIREMIAIQRELELEQEEREFNAAFARLQAKLPILTRKHIIEVKGKVRSKYTAYEDIHAAIQPLLNDEGFTISYNAQIESESKVKVIVSIRRGKIERHAEVALPLDKSEYRNVVQNYGATLTYCKRYALTLALNLVTKDADDDAQSLSLITDEELMQLEDLMAACGIQRASPDEAKFMERLGVKSLADLQRGQPYKMARAALNYRLRLKQEKSE